MTFFSHHMFSCTTSEPKRISFFFQVLPPPPCGVACWFSPREKTPGDARSVVSELEAAVNAKPGAHHVWNDPSVGNPSRVWLVWWLAASPRASSQNQGQFGWLLIPPNKQKLEGKKMKKCWKLDLGMDFFRKFTCFFFASSLCLGSQKISGHLPSLRRRSHFAIRRGKLPRSCQYWICKVV